MKKYKCEDCNEIFDKSSESEIFCPKCYSNSVELVDERIQEKADFDIEDLLKNQYGCRRGCSCS